MVSRGEPADQFAARLRALKERTNRSYEALARRAGVSSSSLHRYCSGQSTPSDYSMVVRIAAACGAHKDEVDELLRVWVLATIRHDPASGANDPAPAESSGVWIEPSRETLRARRSPIKRTPSLAHSRMIVGALALVFAIGGLARSSGPDAQGQRQDQGSDLLLSSSCARVLTKGEYGLCVQALQARLQGAGFNLPVDAAFGPYTKMRVEAFQIFAGLPSTGMVDDETKKALLAPQVKATTWSRNQVQRRLTEVFPEDPDTATNLALCLSALDPLWISGYRDQTRRWGLFQFRDRELVELDVSPATALNPEWNIQAARVKWSATKDFSRWNCQPQADRVPPG